MSRACQYDYGGSSRGSPVSPGLLIGIVAVIIAFGAFAVFMITGNNESEDIKSYTVTINTSDSYYQAIASIVEDLCADKNSLTTIEKYKVLHDFVVDAIDYDYDALVVGSGVSNKEANDPERALFGGYGVCGAYAQIYADLCDYAGLDCEYVTGKAFLPGSTSTTGHAWNAVHVGGQWYHVDCCWSDTGGGLYEYFLRGENYIQVSDGGNFRQMYEESIPFSSTDYKFDRDQSKANINIIWE